MALPKMPNSTLQDRNPKPSAELELLERVLKPFSQEFTYAANPAKALSLKFLTGLFLQPERLEGSGHLVKYVYRRLVY